MFVDWTRAWAHVEFAGWDTGSIWVIWAAIAAGTQRLAVKVTVSRVLFHVRVVESLSAAHRMHKKPRSLDAWKHCPACDKAIRLHCNAICNRIER